jgi:hypothetical protein
MYSPYLLFHEPISRYCLIPTTSHIEEIIIAPSSTPRTKSFWISRIAMNDGCRNKYTEYAIAIGAMITAEILTPKSVFLIRNICSIKVSIRLSIPYRLEEELKEVKEKGDSYLLLSGIDTFASTSSSIFVLFRQ